ncbi:ATP/GTP-binding protein [Streptomyces sp. SID9124]|uniref:ATP/GTP-binding protein n=1 Tax=Streptomyces sp. SID9124 TaxID=2706108 RepID=UPI0013DFDDE1|nr:ATP/GTP-binding protein [Streptomyces sp. SID9124]
MQIKKTALEQHIAVFGESGSGKTVMLSSFYGATQEPQYLQKSLFHVVADEMGQGTRLHRNYLGMRESGRLPAADRFSATSYSFSVRLKDGPDPKANKARPFDALRLVWHDYPGEWFEEDVSGPEEFQRRVDTFMSLLGSDVALVLVDAQRLLENAGQEERYLKSLLTNFRNGLLSIKGDLLKDGKPLVEFPRIWVMALSKSDLLPDLDVFKFRDLLIEKVGDDIVELRKVIAGLVEASDALSVGEDFVLLSSAKFGAEKIEVTKRVGLGLILPLAAMLPFERHVRWAQLKQIPVKVAESLLNGAGSLAAALVGSRGKLPGAAGLLRSVVGLVLSREVLNEAAKVTGEKLRNMNSEAMAKQNYLTATLTGFRMDLDRGEEEQVLLRSCK